MRQLGWQGYCLLLTLAWLMSILLGISPLRSLLPSSWFLAGPVLLVLALCCWWCKRVPARLMLLLAMPLLAWHWQGWHWQKMTLSLELPTEQPIQLSYCVLDWPSQMDRSAGWRVRVRSELGQVMLQADLAISVLRPGDCASSVVRLRASPEFQPPWRPSSAWQQLARAQWQAEVIVPILELKPAPAWQQARHWLWWQLEPLDSSGMVRALVLGSRTAMAGDLQQWLQQLGIFHLLVVSGLHLSLLVLSALWLARSLALPMAMQLWLALSLALAYTLFAGAGLPVSRAFFMAGLTLVIWYWRQPKSLVLLWLMALSLLTLWQPLAVTQASFWLSAMAVGWIFVALLGGGQWWRIQFAIALGLLPWQLYFGLYVNPFAAVYNLLLAPMVLLLLPLLLLAVALLPISQLPIASLLFLLQQLLGVLPLELLPLGQLQPSIGLGQLILAQLLLFLLLMPNPLPGARGLAVGCLLLLLISPAPRPELGNHWLVYARGQQLWLWTEHPNGSIWLLPRAPSAMEELWLWQWGQPFGGEQALLVLDPSANWRPRQDWDRLLLASASQSGSCDALPQPLQANSSCMIWTKDWLWLAHDQRLAHYAWQQQHHARWWLLARGQQDASRHWQDFSAQQLKWSAPNGKAMGLQTESGLQTENLWQEVDGQWQALFAWRHPSSRRMLPSLSQGLVIEPRHAFD